MKTQFKNVSSVYRIDPVHKQPRKLNIALFALSAKKYDLFIGSQLGVESLAGDLRRHFGTDVNVEIIDCQFHNIDLFINKARSGKYDIIGLSVKIGTLEEADKIIRSVLTSDLENKPLFILGNLLATSAPKELLSRYQEFANHLIAVRGEGEELLREIVKERLNNTGSNRSVIDALIQNNTPNMAALKNEQLTLTARQVLDINQLGFPARDTLQTLISVGGLVYIRDGSGCYWNRCTFCTRREY
ncbi:MAG: cobalamin B12-binding domain-containing protein, partial [Candidatus Saganbacteria bacterium]|nr:cobalamin B12-binding domain-containing protein [Candidatus Saganbacteria bacterium]